MVSNKYNYLSKKYSRASGGPAPKADTWVSDGFIPRRSNNFQNSFTAENVSMGGNNLPSIDASIIYRRDQTEKEI